MSAEMRFIVKENIIRGMYDNGNLMIYAADGVEDNKNSCVCSECVPEKGEKKYDYLMPVNLRIILMYVNNESGAINPINEISEYVKKKTHAYMHVD